MLPRRLREEIVAHARAAAPQECCGLVLGDGEDAQRVVRCRNVHATPETRYLIDAKDVVAALRASEDFDRELVAIYHSHPRTQPYPSPTDRADAYWPLAAYVLVSLRSEPPEMYAYRIEEQERVSEIPIVDG